MTVNLADIPVMATCLCFIALVFVVITLVVDSRLRVERAKGL